MNSIPDPGPEDSVMQAWLHGKDCMARSDWAEAVAAFSLAVQHAPHLTMVYAERAQAWMNLGEFAAAERDLAEALTIDSREPNLYLQRALLAMQRQQYDAVYADCLRGLRLNPNLAELYALRACVHVARGLLDRSELDFEQALSLEPLRGYLFHNWRGEVARRQADWDMARREFSASLALQPEQIDILVLRADIASRVGDLDSALADYTEVIRREPDHPGHHFARSLLYLRTDHPQAAQQDCDQAVRLKPDWAEALAVRAQCHQRQGNETAALEDLEAAIQLTPERAALYNQRASLFYHQGQTERALADHTQALELDPANPSSWNAVAWIRATSLDDSVRAGEMALEYAQRACELSDWQDSRYLDTYAAALAECGRFAEAVEWQTRALNLALPSEQADYQQRLDRYQADQPMRDGSLPTPSQDEA